MLSSRKSKLRTSGQKNTLGDTAEETVGKQVWFTQPQTHYEKCSRRDCSLVDACLVPMNCGELSSSHEQKVHADGSTCPPPIFFIPCNVVKEAI